MEDKRKRFNVSKGNKSAMTRDEFQTAYNFDQYGQISFEPTDQLLLIAGVRHSRVAMNVKDHFLTDGDSSGIVAYTNTSPVLGATFKVTPKFNLYANYGRGFETPTFAEMTYSDVLNSKGRGVGAGPNLSMTPSRAKNYEIGAKAFVTDNTRINLALFKVDAKNEIIAFAYDGNAKTTQYASTANTERKGIEISLDSRLPYNFNLYGAYTIMDAEFRNRFSENNTGSPITVTPGMNIPATYKNTGYAELSWKYPAFGFSTATEVVYFSDTYAYDNNKVAFRPGAYTIANMRASLDQKYSNWSVKEFVRLDNIFDRSYVSNVKVNTTTPFEPGRRSVVASRFMARVIARFPKYWVVVAISSTRRIRSGAPLNHPIASFAVKFIVMLTLTNS